MKIWDRTKWITAGALALLGTPLMAETAQTVETNVFKPNMLGMIDIRPTVYTGSGKVGTEDSYELGARLTPDVSLSYLQAVMTTWADPSAAVGQGGFKAALDVSFLRTRVNNILKDEANGLSLSYESRIYAPVASGLRDQGMIAVARNYIKLNKNFSKAFSLMLVEMPVLHFWDKSGYSAATGEAANTAFENRVYLIGTVNFSDKLSLAIPVMFHQTRHRNHAAGAKNNDAWTFVAWTYPELTYAINNELSLGVAYYSDNLLTSVAEALRNGAVQVALTASI